MRALRYPNHFKYIRENYPFLKRRLVNQKIGNAYLGMISYEKSMWNKIMDFIHAVYYRPIFIFKPISKLIRIIIK